jgi:FAD/FMN-containing dehydrogenase
MSQSTPVVSIHPYFRVHSGKLEAAKALLAACVEKTRTEPRCLNYEFTANDHEIFCREAYVGAEGALAHLGNVTPLLGELLKISDLARLEVHGPQEELDKLKGPMANLKPVWFTTTLGVERILMATVLSKLVKRDLINTNGVAVAEDAIAKFATSFHGQLIRPGDLDYDTARKIWNASVDKRPGIIARCAGVSDVVAAVNFARENSLLTAIRGGGHNVGGRALCDGGIVIDLSRMKAVHVDARNRTARVQGGATLGDVDRETHVFGLAVPAGVISKTGIAGLTLGGGVGWLVRKHGLTCDNVLSFEVVTAEGKVVVASAQEHPDLFWALRGGGGNFGVVTSFEFRVHPVNNVLGGLVIHPRDKALEVLRFYRDFIESAPEELTLYCVMLSTPEGAPAIAMAGCYCGDLAEGERVLQPVRAFGAPLVDAFQPMPFPAVQSMLDAGFPDGNFNYWKFAFLRGLTDEAIAIMVEHANRGTSPLTATIIEHYGGAAGRVAPNETAFAHRNARYHFGVLGQWTNPAESPQHVAWARQFAAAMQPFSSGAYLLSFLDQEPDETIKAAFGPNYDRLAAVKKKYDPTNFFRVNHNIKPAG